MLEEKLVLNKLVVSSGMTVEGLFQEGDDGLSRSAPWSLGSY